ncbi:MAG: ankyrin repeat domain-containing protein [Rhodospirillaceae bacterium]|nr:ankyrin repeat domain-containing protein [Rhodospirillaceae bacterium]
MKTRKQRRPPRWGVMCLLGLLLTGPDTASGQERDRARVGSEALRSEQYGAWEGKWISTNSDLEENTYTLLHIEDVSDRGFTYYFECRDIPYGPNAQRSDSAEALFGGPLSAINRASGYTFSLRIGPDDRHDRRLEVQWPPCSHTDVPENIFVWQRPTYRAGFDCDRASTDVETTICRDELLALGDLELTTVYRELMETLVPEARDAVRSAQRAWLRTRDRDCPTGGGADATCIARLYSNRLAALARMQDSSLGTEPRFDARYALALLLRDGDLRNDVAARLAMYPLVMDSDGIVSWQADDSGLLFEQTHVRTEIVWPTDVDVRYSNMLFVGSNGAVWTAAHVAPAGDATVDVRIRAELHAARPALTVRSETGGEPPRLVSGWLRNHPAPAENDAPGYGLAEVAPTDCRGWNTEGFFTNATGADVKFCLDMGMSVDARDAEDATPLHLAAEFGMAATIEMLVDAGADIEARAYWQESIGGYEDKYQWTPLRVAIAFGTADNVTALIEAGAETEEQIGWAAVRGSPANLEALIDAGADVETALFEAARSGTPAAINMLVGAGAMVTARNENGSTPLHVAAGASTVYDDPPDVVANIAAILEAGADIDARDEHGHTPLHLAVRGDRARIAALLAAGADIDAQSDNGRTPLHMAAAQSYEDLDAADSGVLSALLDAGADLEARDEDGQTPLHVAARQLDARVPLEALLDAGARTEARDQFGRTPLHLAAEVEYHEWSFDNLGALLDAGADVEARDDEGRTPVHVARDIERLTGNADNATRLIGAGAAGGRSAGVRESSPDSAPGEPQAAAAETLAAGDFGDDSGLFPNDDQCDDRRFTGDGVGFRFQAGQDRADCYRLLNEGRVRWSDRNDSATARDNFRSLGISGVDSDVFRPFADKYIELAVAAGFAEKGLSAELAETFSNTITDEQSDEVAVLFAGLSELLGGMMIGMLGDHDVRDFGRDSGASAIDGVCDDLRFAGDGMRSGLVLAQIMTDASDCRMLLGTGRIRWRSGPDDLADLASALEASEMFRETMLSPEDVAEFGHPGIPEELTGEVLREAEQAMKSAASLQIARWLLGEQ